MPEYFWGPDELEEIATTCYMGSFAGHTLLSRGLTA